MTLLLKSALVLVTLAVVAGGSSRAGRHRQAWLRVELAGVYAVLAAAGLLVSLAPPI